MSPDMEETDADRQFQPQPGCCEDCDDELTARRDRRRATRAPATTRWQRLPLPSAMRQRLRARYVRVTRWRYRRDTR